MIDPRNVATHPASSKRLRAVSRDAYLTLSARARLGDRWIVNWIAPAGARPRRARFRWVCGTR